MRAVVLSDDRVIEFLNENFINTWVPNSELGRVPSLQEPIAKRRKREGKTFDTSHALAQAIMKGWKEKSPADSLVISPEFELMGRQPVNELVFSRDSAQRYLTFLKLSLDGKYYGLRENTLPPEPSVWEALPESDNTMVDDLKVVLTHENPEQEILSIFRTPEGGYQDYTVVEIDTTAFEKGGMLIIDIWVGDAEAAGSFDLFAGDSELPTKGTPRNALQSAWGISPQSGGVIQYYFYRGQVFKLGATGDWFSEKGSINGFLAKISVESGQELEPKKVSSTHPYQSPEDLVNAFVKAFKNLDSEALDSMLTGNAKESLEIDDVPEGMRAQLSQMLSQVEVVSSEYVDDEFHFRLRMPAASPPEVSVKMQKVEGIWLVYDVEPVNGD